jgi:hypothetical protein
MGRVVRSKRKTRGAVQRRAKSVRANTTKEGGHCVAIRCILLTSYMSVVVVLPAYEKVVSLRSRSVLMRPS